jgi:DNA-binding transcriptional regulator YhcF (GntR family)
MSYLRGLVYLDNIVVIDGHAVKAVMVPAAGSPVLNWTPKRRHESGSMVEKTGRPGYLQIADELRQQVSEGRLGPGDALPSTAQLREQYDVSAGVVKAAISVLRTEGLVIGQQGKGVFVRDQPSGYATVPPELTGEDEMMDLTEQLGAVLDAVRDLGERVARLEESVFAEPPKADPSDK